MKKILTVALLPFLLIAEETNEKKKEKRFINKISTSLFHYKYEEPNLMEVKGVFLGLDYAGTWKITDRFFLKGESLIAGGEGKYTSKGTGSRNNDPSWYIDLRMLGGMSFDFTSQSLKPFAGIAYRFLENDGDEKYTTTGHYGYLRRNHLYYGAIGLTHTIKFSKNQSIDFTYEYDHLIRGYQYSYLKEETIKNKQTKGYGLRFAVDYNIKSWSFGPFVRYWNIASTDWVVSENGIEEYREPKNNTTEIGLKVSFSF